MEARTYPGDSPKRNYFEVSKAFTTAAVSPEPGTEREYVINLYTDATDSDQAHDVALRVLAAVRAIPELLTASTTVSTEERVERVLIKPAPAVAP